MTDGLPSCNVPVLKAAVMAIRQQPKGVRGTQRTQMAAEQAVNSYGMYRMPQELTYHMTSRSLLQSACVNNSTYAVQISRIECTLCRTDIPGSPLSGSVPSDPFRSSILLGPSFDHTLRFSSLSVGHVI